MKHYLQKRENRITLAFFLITMIVAMAPLVSRYCINGHDIEYHLLRIESLKEGIRIGRPFFESQHAVLRRSGICKFSVLFGHSHAHSGTSSCMSCEHRKELSHIYGNDFRAVLSVHVLLCVEDEPVEVCGDNCGRSFDAVSLSYG